VGKYYYENMASAAFTEHADLGVKAILQAELEYFNISTALRMKNADAPQADIMAELVSPSPGGLAAQIASAVKIGDAVKLVESSIPEVGDLAKEFEQTHRLADVELALEKRMFQKILSATRASVLSLGAVLGYVYLKRREIENLRTIALSLQFASKEELRKGVYALRS
jgi:vacuolar-type H+-ATPase subunit C/Vma6